MPHREVLTIPTSKSVLCLKFPLPHHYWDIFWVQLQFASRLTRRDACHRFKKRHLWKRGRKKPQKCVIANNFLLTPPFSYTKNETKKKRMEGEVAGKIFHPGKNFR